MTKWKGRHALEFGFGGSPSGFGLLCSSSTPIGASSQETRG